MKKIYKLKFSQFNKVFFVTLLMFCLGSCNTPHDNISGFVSDTLEDVKEVKVIPLSSLVEDCRLIHLDNTTDEALFKAWFITVTDRYIGVRQHGSGTFKLFDHSGKFLCNVGSVGQGPGEYAISLYDEIIDDENELIYLSSIVGNKILVYNTSGKYIKNIPLPHDMGKAKLHLSDSVISVVYMPFENDRFVAYQITKGGKILQSVPAPPHFVVYNYDGELFSTRNTSTFDFRTTNSDTLYCYDIKNNKISPKFTLSVKSSEKPFRSYIELKNKYLTCVFGKEYKVISTDKDTKNSSYIKVVNDYYGNLEMPISIVTIKNGWFVYNLEPIQLMEQIEKRLAESDCSKQDKQQLKTVLATLDENDNNILFVGKLK
jgi:hypothetical protein